MLSYRHIFHAGNFADVVKHSVLCLLLQALRVKDKPFCYIETHAGAGRYDLHREAAKKNREYEGGIARLWDLTRVPAELTAYLSAVRSLNPTASGALRYYPGSPRIVRTLLRPQDRMRLMELHTTDSEALHKEFLQDKQVTVFHQDGYEGLKALLPPPERRGLVMMDPAFELRDERTRLVEALQAAWSRWPTGMYALWYPVLERRFVAGLEQLLLDSGVPKILCVELCIQSDDVPRRLNGSGLFIINPPWQIENSLEQLMAWLQPRLALDARGGTRVAWLVPEVPA